MTAHILASGCSVKPIAAPKPKTVTVNGVVISRSAIAQEIQNHPAAKPIDAWLAAARALVVRELLLQEARRLAIEPTPLVDADGRRETDEEAMIRRLVEQEVRTPLADEVTCRRYYDANRRRFRSADLFEVRHILLAAAPRDKEARSRAKGRIEAIVVHLRQDPAAFGALAEAESCCPSARTGGSLGQIGPGQTVPEFEQALARLQPGETTQVETRYGFHVVHLDRRIDGVELPFEVVRERIATWLDDKVRRSALRQYISILAGRADISGIELASSPSPLVQ